MLTHKAPHLLYAVTLSALLTLGQDKAAVPAVPFSQILACAQAANCKNMKKSVVTWFDMGGLPVVAFSDETGGYALRVASDGLCIWITPPGENRPSEGFTLSAEKTVVRGELGPMKGDPPMVGTWSPEEKAQWIARHKSLSATAGGEEFRTFWEAQAAQALAAIRRQLAR